MSSVGCSTLVTCALPMLPARSPAGPEVVRDAVVAWDGGALTYAGPRSGWSGPVDEELTGRTVVPGFVDCHTHMPFFGWRDDEYEARLRGASYRDLHGEGGIPRSARMLAEASDEEVLEFCRPQTAAVTLLACHAVPDGMNREAWVDAVRAELVPTAAREGLVDAVDVYVEDIAFSTDDLERVAEAAAEEELPLRVHADQLGTSGAAEAAVRLGARSADHLNRVSDGGVTALIGGGTVAVLLPTSTLLLRAQPPPVDRLARGAALALATDCNPGTSPVASMPEAVALGCAMYGLAPLEALVAATANAAWVLGLHDRIGSLEPGKRADFVVLDTDEFRRVPYRPGHNPVVAAFLGGEPVRW